MDVASEYRIYALAQYLNSRADHQKDAEYCTDKMVLIAELYDLSPHERQEIEAEVKEEVDLAFKNHKPKKIEHFAK